ncbi:hypothetical protein ENZ76_20065 [Mesorhizobium sp. M7A.F.Ca.CA.002.10.1.1]|nr:hypothetical protein EOC84_02575 [Mesorhizobium sp. Primo-B]RUU35345.1 hypothetical protein EOC83_25945 [Mesorhizobium sp. Primo-A]RUX15703.1 hypothetical protein EN996_11950 [Mesorhizobium sp. M7A.F.Ca.CA.002.14.1.2]RUX39566.1 hypothetical protein EN987_11410 [Mesorhizobium sp. M7A.F.Ca.CA.002.11.2.1]RUX49624.1 hypothetical protein EN994_19240 [Mesorhizobium sp. M7A.F.Ca.CA.002.09.1.1]RUX57393.1 hypothetical protein EN989_19990 [Mesorhizobium sp. M7A.F.Ca.CA.002.12.1.1]RUY38351.1 hypothet
MRFYGGRRDSAPPLACRPSPPQVGRSAVIIFFANPERDRNGGAAKLPISPLEGEMSGRTEGGATEHRGPRGSSTPPPPPHRHQP